MSVSTIKELKTQINILEKRSQLMEDALMTKLHQYGEDFTPFKFLKEGLFSVIRMPGLRGKLIGAGVSLALGFLANKFIIGKSGGILRKVAGSALQLGVTNLIARKLPFWKNLASNLFSRKNGI